jgi:lipopolysaccharide/colanic/teichoic acid biosynthesis glycosyltransferase
MKRIFDIAASAAAIAILALPMLVIYLAVRLGSRGGGIFRQRRAGLHGKPFTMLKFRTMRIDTDPYGISPHSPEDPRLTRVGRLLRETSLDELPQLFNVLAGSMSLVGPRPLYERQAAGWDAEQRRRLDVKPGLTGYAQVLARGEATIEDKIALDLEYVDKHTFLLDLKLIWLTVVKLFAGGQIYEKRYSRDKERENHS